MSENAFSVGEKKKEEASMLSTEGAAERGQEWLPLLV